MAHWDGEEEVGFREFLYITERLGWGLSERQSWVLFASMEREGILNLADLIEVYGTKTHLSMREFRPTKKKKKKTDAQHGAWQSPPLLALVQCWSEENKQVMMFMKPNHILAAFEKHCVGRSLLSHKERLEIAFRECLVKLTDEELSTLIRVMHGEGLLFPGQNPSINPTP